MKIHAIAAYSLAIASIAAGYISITPAFADQHADNCKYNYDQCVKGCDGASSCERQCKENYDKCMQN